MRGWQRERADQILPAHCCVAASWPFVLTICALHDRALLEAGLPGLVAGDAARDNVAHSESELQRCDLIFGEEVWKTPSPIYDGYDLYLALV